jgi:hypothetical protein
MWKEQLLKPVSVMGSNIPTKPKRDKGTCIEKLEKAINYAMTHANSFHDVMYSNELHGQTTENIVIPEEIICKVIEMLKPVDSSRYMAARRLVLHNSSLGSSSDGAVLKDNDGISWRCIVKYNTDKNIKILINIYPIYPPRVLLSSRSTLFFHMKSDWDRENESYNNDLIQVLEMFLSFLGYNPNLEELYNAKDKWWGGWMP